MGRIISSFARVFIANSVVNILDWENLVFDLLGLSAEFKVDELA